jgi:hypothetical protein
LFPGRLDSPRNCQKNEEAGPNPEDSFAQLEFIGIAPGIDIIDRHSDPNEKSVEPNESGEPDWDSSRDFAKNVKVTSQDAEEANPEHDR